MATWTNVNKNSATWTKANKNAASWSNAQKSGGTASISTGTIIGFPYGATYATDQGATEVTWTNQTKN